MKILGGLFLIFCIFAACSSEKHDHQGKTPLVEVNGKFLYEEDLRSVLPQNLSKDDSVLFAEHYIKDWAEGILLYDKAESNIPDNEKINELVENYRKALILHTYQQELINQKVSQEITEEEMKEYYDANKQLFTVDRPLIKGLFMKVPLGASGLNNVRVWYKQKTSDAIEKLEKYSLQNAVSYDYFYDRWLLASEVLDKIPLKVSNPEQYLDDNRHIELRDTAFCYFLHVEDFLGAGKQEPFDFAEPQIKDILVNLKQVDFMREVKNDLYQNAIDKKKIIYYY